MNKYYEHLHTLCIVHNVHFVLDITLRREQCYALPMHRTVVSPAVDDDTQYAAVLHEMGHCCHTHPKLFLPFGVPTNTHETTLLLQEEDYAWEWAQQHALEWTAPMAHVHAWARETYRKRLEEMVKADMGLKKAALSVKGWK